MPAFGLNFQRSKTWPLDIYRRGCESIRTLYRTKPCRSNPRILMIQFTVPNETCADKPNHAVQKARSGEITWEKTASVKWDKPSYHLRTLTGCSVQGRQRHKGSRLSPMQSEGGEDLELKLHQEEPVCQGWWPAVGGLREHFLDAGWFQVLGRAC